VVSFFLNMAQSLETSESPCDSIGSNRFAKIAEALEIDQDDVPTLIKRNATGTARAIMRLKYPCPAIDIRIGDLDHSFISNIISE